MKQIAIAIAVFALMTSLFPLFCDDELLSQFGLSVKHFWLSVLP